jgi:hypothetical protein
MRIAFTTSRLLPALAFGLMLVAGCGESAENDGHDHDGQHEHGDHNHDGHDHGSDGMAVSQRTNTLKKIFHAAPSPVETAAMVRRSGATFHADELNPTDNVAKYLTSDRQAINLGIYGADLSYATIFEEHAKSLEYLGAVKTLASQLGISDVINDDVIAQADAAREDRDALIDIVSDSFYSLNERLKSNGMEDLAGLVVAAGWVESMYLATQHLGDATPDLKARLAEQSFTLDDVMRLCRSYEATPELTALLELMAPIEEAFAAVTVTPGQATANQAGANTIVIGGGPSVQADFASLQAIADAVAAARNASIQ